MVKLPGAEDLSATPSGRSGRAIASYDTTAIGRGVAQLGQGMQSLASDLKVAQKQKQADVDQATRFETQRRFLEFSAQQDDALIKAGDSAQPGAFGFREAYAKAYQDRAKEFFSTVPEALKPEYDTKLFQAEDSLAGRALTFERQQRKSYYSTKVNDGLTLIENNLYKNPANFTANLAEGNAFIDSIPDEDVSAIDKDAMRRDWRTKAQLASLNGLPPAARVAAMGGGSFKATYSGSAQPKGEMANLVAAEANAAGVDPAIALGIVQIESGFDPNAKASTSSAGGLWQFTDGTANGYGLTNKFDAKANAAAGAKLTRDNTDGLRRDLGRDPTPGEVYLAHFSGFGMAKRLSKADPNTPAEQLFSPEAVRANRSILAGKTAGEVRAWADRKMADAMQKAAGVSVSITGGGEVDPRYSDMPWDQRQKVVDGAQTELRQEQADQRVAAQFTIDNAVTNAPISIQNTGTYSGSMPTQEQFVAAYGDKAAQKFNEFQQTIETSQAAFRMQTMPADEVAALVEDAEPTSNGDNAALQQQRYEVLAKAADQTLKARAADPATYARQAFPRVDAAWNAASDPASYQAAVAASIAAQEQLGVQVVRPLPKNIAADAVGVFKDQKQPEANRIAAVSNVLMTTSDPGQRRALFEQLVDAGLPDITEGAVEALSRGDNGAAQRLFQAAIVDPGKLPGDNPETPARVSEAIQSTLMAPGEVGDVYYGLSNGSAENFTRAERDAKLLTNAVNIRMRNGEDLDQAIAGVSKDLYGDVQAISGDDRVNAQILIPKDQDPYSVLNGLAAVEPKVKTALQGALSRPGAEPAGPVKGLVDKGNIDLAKRPVVKNADGSTSTVRSMSFEEDGKEVLVPTVSPDGKMLTDDEAIDLYRQTGQYLGKFDNPANATAYAEALHSAQETFYTQRASGTGAVIDAATQGYIDNVLAEGFFRNSGDGFVFIDPYVGAAVSDETGKPIIFRIPEMASTSAAPSNGFSQRAQDESAARMKAFQ